jgi:hypothetical protein
MFYTGLSALTNMASGGVGQSGSGGGLRFSPLDASFVFV